ncbi:MAG TPA: DUF5995 family protein, partial [Streptosporangiaceae bacterium]|nr:DUF5995 family protein [Streptosporangiaceae bacterium]
RIVAVMSAGLPAPPGPVTTVAGVITRMEAIETALPATDGLACFNRMYLQVTRQISSRLGEGFFTDPAFMTYLDVAFASLYFDAAGGPAVPLAWQPLAEERANTGIEPVQFALAGMNAHINHDLPLALVATCTALATSPDAGAHFADYQKVDQLLDAAEQSLRESFESAPELAVDHHLTAVNNLIASWTINSARDLAWNNCLLLWAVRDDPIASGLLAGSLARSAALASRLLLVAV